MMACLILVLFSMRIMSFMASSIDAPERTENVWWHVFSERSEL